MSQKLYKQSAAVILSAFIIASSSSISANAAEVNFGTADAKSNITIPLNHEPIVLEQNKVYTLPQIHSHLFDGVTYNITTGNSNVINIQNNTIITNGTGTATIYIQSSNGKAAACKVAVK